MVKTKYNTNKKKKEKIGKYNKAYSPSSLGSTFRPELINKLSSYCSLIGMDRTKYISEVLFKELEGLILTNDFITLEEPFYFNWQELEEKGIVKAATEEPVQDLEKCYLVKKIANNFDVFEQELRTYCFKKNPNLHRGIYFYPKPVFYESTLEFKELLVYPLLFNYNTSNKGSLEISLIKINNLDMYINFENVTEEDLFSDLRYYVDNIIDNEGNLNNKTWTSTFEVIESFESFKEIKDSLATGKGVIEDVKNFNPNAKVTSSTSPDLINYLDKGFKTTRAERLNNLELQEEIKNKNLLEWFFNPEKKVIDYSKFIEVEFKEQNDK